MAAPHAPRVLLFDIDGTLLHAGGAGRRAVERALHHHFGEQVHPRPASLGGMRLDGMTDRRIIRLVMESLELPFDDATCDAVLESYVGYLEEEIDGPGFRVMPGVERLLPLLRERGAPLGLCTGNVARGARIKLRRAGLDGFFDLGEKGIWGFAHDGEDRERIVAAALQRASRALGRTVLPGEALIVGDTPRDVDGGRSVGVPVLAVATGRFSVEELLAAGADRALPSLEAPGALAALLGDGAA